MNINQKLLAHVISVSVLIALFHYFVGFEVGRKTAIFLACLLVVDLAGDFWTLLTIKRDVNKLSACMNALSQGDLTVESPVSSSGEVAELQRALQTMIQTLRKVVMSVRLAADSVGTVSSEVSQSSLELSESIKVQVSSADNTARSSSELSSAVSQTSSSISELAASIQQVAEHVSHANTVSEHASASASAGEIAVAKAIASMDAIFETMNGIQATIQLLEQRSEEIGGIVETIDDIAEQTNLLALNAAIEAARAGEAGRGFAVVADAVRHLAARSTKATGEISNLIKAIQKDTSAAVGVTQLGSKKVEEGGLLATETGDALSRIIAAARETSDLLHSITSTTREQARSSQQIASAAEQMNSVNHVVSQSVESLNYSAQQSAGATKHVSMAASDLDTQAQSLMEAVGFFKLPDTVRRPVKEVVMERLLAAPQERGAAV